MKSDAMKNAFNRIKAKAGLPYFRPQDIRHWAITELAEQGVSMAQIMSYAGHLRPKMQRHYTAISEAAMLRIAKTVAFSGLPKKPPQRAVEDWRLPTAAVQ
jgi:integrase